MRLLALLKRLEFLDCDGLGEFCPECGEEKGSVHRLECELKAAIDQFSEVVTLAEFSKLFHDQA